MLPQTQKMQAKLRKYADSPGSYEGGRGYWDDLCLTNFLEGVCYRFLAWPVRVGFIFLHRFFSARAWFWF